MVVNRHRIRYGSVIGRIAAMMLAAILAIGSSAASVMALTEIQTASTDSLPQLGGDPTNAISVNRLERQRSSAWNNYINSVCSSDGFEEFYSPLETSNETTITIDGVTMKVWIAWYGEEPDGGYPLYIALHGGGGVATETNDSQWEQMKNYYWYNLDCGVYIAVRAVSDTWKCHWEDISFPLYDQLIQYVILSMPVNPNKVYIEGFSAGGDGVYQIASKMADRFAAANMSAGHPNGTSIVNLRNVGFQIQVGENDKTVDRNKVAAEYGGKLEALQAKYGGYPHRTHIVAGKAHNFADWSKDPLDVMKDPQAWLAAVNAGETYSETISEDCFPPDYMDQFTRDPLATDVVWDLSDRITSRSVKSFYWLTAPDETNKGIVVTSYDKSKNTVTLETEEVEGDFSVLLNEEMIDYSKPVTFVVDGGTVTANIIPDSAILTETTEERGDPNYQFESRVSYSELKALAEHEHSYGEVSYSWSDDKSTCTASRVCSECGDEDKEVSTATSKVTKAATCTEKGVRTYTAAFENEAFETKTCTEEIAATGHSYELSGWEWVVSNDGSSASATAEFTCMKNSSHTEKVGAEISSVVQDSSCQEDGVVTFTATAVLEGQTYTDKYSMGIEKKAHEWQDPKYTWEDLVCTASRKCANCETEETETVSGIVTSSKAAGCEEKGCTVYTAEFKNTAFEAQTKEVEIAATGHVWNEGVVTKEATATEAGERTYTCTVCGGTKTEVIPAIGTGADNGSDTGNDTGDNTNTGSGSGSGSNAGANTNTGTAAAIEAAIYGMTSDTDIAGSDILTLKLRSTKQGKNSIKLAWNGVGGAVKYVVYGNRCGSANTMKKLAETTACGLDISSIEGVRLKKGTYHKFIVVAVDAAGNSIATSKTIHVATKGGKKGNYSKVRVTNSKKLKSIKAGKTVKIKAKAGGRKVKKHVGLRYESSNPAVAAVSKSGKVKALSKGTATIIVYAQNGKYKTAKVTVK